MADKVQLRINLQALVRVTYRDNKQAIRAISPIVKKRDVSKEFGERIIDEIVRRTTKENVDKNGKEFEGYSKSYMKSKVFEIYGKRSGDVNLVLTEKMLSNMIVKFVGDGVAIEFANKSENNKAHGHINGIPRKTESGRLTKVRRNFFGVPEDVQIKILKKVVKDYQTNSFDFESAREETGAVDG